MDLGPGGLDLGGFSRIYMDLHGPGGKNCATLFPRGQDVCRPVASFWRPVARESWPLKKDCSNPRLQYPKLGDL